VHTDGRFQVLLVGTDPSGTAALLATELDRSMRERDLAATVEVAGLVQPDSAAPLWQVPSSFGAQLLDSVHLDRIEWPVALHARALRALRELGLEAAAFDGVRREPVLATADGSDLPEIAADWDLTDVAMLREKCQPVVRDLTDSVGEALAAQWPPGTTARWQWPRR